MWTLGGLIRSSIEGLSSFLVVFPVENMLELWGQAIRTVESLLQPAQRSQWLRPIECVGISAEGRIHLRAPNRYHKEWFEDNYLPSILDELQRSTQRVFTVDFEIVSEAAMGMPEVAPAQMAPAIVRAPVPTTASLPANLLGRYTFDKFVVGPTNRFAHSAARMVAESPGQKWNPLFIHGGVGVGKTHLLHAVGHEIKRQHPDWRIVSVTCEKFVTDFIGSIMNQNRGGGISSMEEFRARYREVPDVLLIDDIQFLSNKDSSQDEFFHTFNALHHTHKQIVLTCDKLPGEVPGLEDRLSSRFTWGLLAEMGMPDVETRVAILKRKAEGDGVSLTNDVALHLASAIKTNVRDLEGAFARLSARAAFEHRPITLDLAREALKNFLPDTPGGITVETIQREVASYFAVKISDLKGPRRHRAISHPRAIAMYLTRTMTPLSFPEIGSRFGGKDHSTVITAVRKIKNLIEVDPAQRSVVKTIESHLRDG